MVESTLANPVRRALARNLRAFAWTVLAYNIGVILWGAWVRVTGSGAGCGNHWPMCNGEMIPRARSTQTLIEFAHRAMSGMSVALLATLVIGIFAFTPRKHPARLFSLWSAALLFAEALIGAGLVLFELVAGNTSWVRAPVMGAHLVNTFFLIAALTLTAWSLAPGNEEPPTNAPLAERWVKLAIFGFIITGFSGGVAALGDTLFRTVTLADGLRADFTSAAHIFLKLRGLHPLLALLTSVFVGFVASKAWQAGARRGPPMVLVFLVAQLSVGIVNLALMAPGSLQIIHLALADLLCMAFVFTCAEWSLAQVPDQRLQPNPETLGETIGYMR